MRDTGMGSPNYNELNGGMPNQKESAAKINYILPILYLCSWHVKESDSSLVMRIRIIAFQLTALSVAKNGLDFQQDRGINVLMRGFSMPNIDACFRGRALKKRSTMK
jgi:hypothetical protein